MKNIVLGLLVIMSLLSLIGCGRVEKFTEKEKESMIAEYLISPDKTPSEVFDFIKEQYGDGYMDVIEEWNLTSYYEKVQYDKSKAQ